MLTSEQRTAVLELWAKGQGKRAIARTLKISRNSVREVIRSGSTTPPEVRREAGAAAYHSEILSLHANCKSNLQRVHEELQAMGAEISYPALTAYCRRHGIGVRPKRRSGEYHFGPGEEIQHDTSPHRLTLAGKERLVQTASAVLCYSRMLFFQHYPTFNRFYCKVFLTDALRYLGGAGKRMVIDNTSVVVLRGTGAGMVPVTEMEAFADRFGFTFLAHEVGHADRKGRVEAPFRYIEGNFLAGRTFDSWEDLNTQARSWCDKVNRSYKRHLRTTPVELYAIERLALAPLPEWIPEVYHLHHRTVDMRGYVTVNTNRYSAPDDWIDREVEVRETKDRIIISLDARRSVAHERVIDKERATRTLAEHRTTPGRRRRRRSAGHEEQLLATAYPQLGSYVTLLKKKGKKQVTLVLKQLLRMAREYPAGALLDAVKEAERYGLYDLDRVERMVLRRIANEYFNPAPLGHRGRDD